jgi:Raf kinase inhibitor-like YbhB/YbcL family protein
MVSKGIRKYWRLSLVILMVMPILACTSASSVFQINSSAFSPGGRIPAKYTIDGANTSPPLSWSNAPDGTKSFALILDDPDAPRPGGFTHWVVYNIPGDRNSLPDNVPASPAQISVGGVQGNNGAGKVGYIGPAPPQSTGTHLYRFNLYALDTILSLGPGATKDDLMAAMITHMLGNALLTGTYSYVPPAS